MDYRRTYSQMPDHALQELSKHREDLMHDALAALTYELAFRGLRELRGGDTGPRAYETLGGVVVTQRTIRIPSFCACCMKDGIDVWLKIASSDGETKYRVFYTRRVSRTYEFPFCRVCASELGRTGQPGHGVWFQNLPTTQYDLFYFFNRDYANAFLAVNA